jgi:hypothetical protein
MKRYNFKTKKIYESVTQYTLRFCEYTEEESEDIGLDLEKDTKPIVGKIFDTIDDAVEYALNDCEKRAINLGIDTNNVEYDVEYARNVSFLLDVRIICETFGKVLKRDGISSATSATMEPFQGTKKSEDVR